MLQIKRINWSRIAKCFFYCLALIGMTYVAVAHAQESGTDTLGGIAGRISESFKNVARLITGIAYVAGMGFAVGAIFKFKAHKDNPTQIPIGTPIALLFIGAALIFLPNIFITSGKTIFGSDATIAGPSGSAYFGSFGQGGATGP